MTARSELEQAKPRHDIAPGAVSDLAPSRGSAPDHVGDVVAICRQRSASYPDRCDQSLQDILQPPLDGGVAEPAAPIMRLQFLDGMMIVVECVEIGEDDIALDLAG
jgi:hypothetical protein